MRRSRPLHEISPRSSGNLAQLYGVTSRRCQSSQASMRSQTRKPDADQLSNFSRLSVLIGSGFRNSSQARFWLWLEETLIMGEVVGAGDGDPTPSPKAKPKAKAKTKAKAKATATPEGSCRRDSKHVAPGETGGGPETAAAEKAKAKPKAGLKRPAAAPKGGSMKRPAKSEADGGRAVRKPSRTRRSLLVDIMRCRVYQKCYSFLTFLLLYFFRFIHQCPAA